MPRQDTDTLPGFGLASIKQEGMCSSYEHPEIKPWPGYGKEFDLYFQAKYGKLWCLKPLTRILKNILKHSWDQALLTNAKKKGEPNAQKGY